jgi:hypothetical protein
MSRTHHHGRWNPSWVKPVKPWVNCGPRKTTVSHMTTPTAWTRMRMNRPKRYDNKRLLREVMHNLDYDATAFPLGSRKPHVYYY